jgi:predicted acyltransferase
MNPAPRLVSLDAFRGATVAAMLLVNNPGSWKDVYPPLLHAEWHGWSATDLVFPCFLWIMGVAMTFSFARRGGEGADRGRLMGHVWRRAAIIFALGLLLGAFPFGLLPAHHFSLATMRIPGVLQRIALCYLAAGTICLRTGWRGQAAWAVALLAGYWAMLELIPVPGHGAGELEALGSLPWWVDSHLLAGHTWSGAPVPGFDPEGILSTLPAIASTLLGALAGQWLRSTESGGRKSLGLLLGGGLLLGTGALLDRWLPINKNLWTSSYAVFMAGWAMVLLAGFYWLIDGRGWKRWATPLVALGMNAIVMFVLAGVVARLLGLISWTGKDGAADTLKQAAYQRLFVPWASPCNASLAFAVAFVAVHLLIAWGLWRKRWFVKI